MSISSIGSSNWVAQTTSKRQNVPVSIVSATTTSTPTSGVNSTDSSSSAASALTASTQNSGTASVADQFINYMKETPAQMAQDAWLSRHGISKEDFAAMSGPEKQKIVDEMKTDLAAEAKQKTEAQAKHGPIDISA